jgi:hypothetical protein
MLGMLLASLDLTVVSTTLSTIAGDVRAGVPLGRDESDHVGDAAVTKVPSFTVTAA